MSWTKNNTQISYPPTKNHLVLASCALALSALVPQAEAKPCNTELPPVDLGNLALTFADNGDGTFEGTGVSGTLKVNTQGVTVLANATGQAANATDLHLRFPGSQLHLVAGQGSAGGRVERFTLGSTRGSSLDSYTVVEALDAYPGVDLQITAGQRRLWLTFEAESAEAVKAIRLAAPGAKLGLSAVDRLLLSDQTLGAGDPLISRRSFEMELVALDTSERRLDASLAIEDGSVSVHLNQAVRGPVKIMLTALLAPHTEATDVEVLNDGRLMTVMPGRMAEGSDRRAAVIHQLDPEGRQLLSTFTVDADRDFEIAGLAEDARGRLILVGSQHQADLVSPIVLNLDLERGQLQPSRALAELPAISVHDAVSTDDGQLLLVGQASSEPTHPNTEVGEVTLALPLAEGEPAPGFLAVVDLEGDAVTAAIPFQSHKKFKKLRAWTDCWGQIHLGYPWLLSAMSASHTYSITVPSNDFQNCPRIDESHGFGALCWKARRSVANWTYHPFNVNFADVPSTLVYIRDPNDPNAGGVSDHVQLNRLENNQFGNLYYHQPSSQWDDPGGGWGADLNWAYSKVELAIAAALYQERWLSPIFANLRVATDIDPEALRAVMLRSETFSAPNTNQLPHNVCNEDLDNNGQPDWNQSAWPKPPEHQVAAACAGAHSSDFTLDNIQYDTWRVGAAYLPDRTLLGSDNSWWPFFSPYVGDPPTDDGKPELKNVHLREISSRLATRAKVPVTLQLTTYSNGSQKTAIQDAWIAASRLD